MVDRDKGRSQVRVGRGEEKRTDRLAREGMRDEGKLVVKRQVKEIDRLTKERVRCKGLVVKGKGKGDT